MTKTQNMQQLMTAEEVAEVLRVSSDWVYRAARLEQLPSLRVGRNVRFRRQDITEFVGGA